MLGLLDYSQARSAALITQRSALHLKTQVVHQNIASDWPRSMAVAKDASDCDFRALARALTADIVALRCLPAWPAADAALLRLVGVAAGTRGLGAPDAATRQVGCCLGVHC